MPPRLLSQISSNIHSNHGLSWQNKTFSGRGVCVPVLTDFLFADREFPKFPSPPDTSDLLFKISDVLPVSTITSDKCKIQFQ